jgi:hypothetical protein
MANFKSISNQGSFASLSSLYAKAKSANNITGVLDSSNIVDFDGLIGKNLFNINKINFNLNKIKKVVHQLLI